MIFKKQVRFVKAVLPMMMLFTSANIYANSADSWKVEVGPYLWMVGMSGHIQLATVREPISQSFGDILHRFEGGGMIWVDARKDKIGLFTDAMYVVLSEHITNYPVETSTNNNLGLFTAGLSYEVFQKTFNPCSQIRVEPYLGVRFTINNASLKIGGTSLKNHHDWTDPIVGVKATYAYNKWQAILAGDIGGINTSTQDSYNVKALAGYKPTKNSNLYLGYQLLYQKYINGGGFNQFVWNMKLYGPMIGGTIEFS